MGRRVVKRSKNSGKIKNATKLELSDGTKFRSKLELFCYNKLLENGIDDFKYEEEKFLLMEPFTFNNISIEPHEKNTKEGKIRIFGESNNEIRAITYLPDFTCIKDKVGWVIETKGYANTGWPNKLKMFKKYLVDNEYKVQFYMPNNQGNVLKCIQMIKEQYYG